MYAVHGGRAGASGEALRSIGLVVAVVAVVLTAACGGGGVGGESSPTPDAESTLLARVPAGGSLPVIVRLAGQYTAEGDLPDEHARQVQRKKISAAQTAVLAELAGYQVRNVHRFAYTPQLSLTVDADALRHLLRSSRVAAVHEDTARSQNG